MDYIQKLESLLAVVSDEGASDLHISSGHPPILRIQGELIPFGKEILKKEETKELAFALLGQERRERFLKEKEIDFSYTLLSEGKPKSRFRVNIFFENGNISSALRLISSKVNTIEELGLPPILHKFTKAEQGFVLITGPSSHGKSTTLAALIDEINHTRKTHIITIEDPIEYIFEDEKSVIDQREVYQDTLSFARALKSTFRQDPDVIMVGEMRDPVTMATAITAAETGHLVFATLHTNSASQTVHRIVDSFPPQQQAQIRAQLSGNLLGVISQRLVKNIKGGLIPACEVLLQNPAVANLIRENKIHELPLVIETSMESGMISLNRSLANLVKRKKITLQEALKHSSNSIELESLINSR
jgi:twitching motility protein PilT